MVSDLSFSREILIFIIIAYLIGSIPFAVIVSKMLTSNDPRFYGSMNPGATNVFRTGSKLAAGITLFGDILKGWLPFYFCESFGLNLSYEEFSAIALSVFFGHIHSIFLKFKGGKGVATSIGILIAIHPALATAIILTWLTMILCFCYASLASLVCALFGPIYYIFGSGIMWNMNKPVAATLILINSLLLCRHKKNIMRLLQGKENPIVSAGKKEP